MFVTNLFPDDLLEVPAAFSLYPAHSFHLASPHSTIAVHFLWTFHPYSAAVADFDSVVDLSYLDFSDLCFALSVRLSDPVFGLYSDFDFVGFVVGLSVNFCAKVKIVTCFVVFRVIA